jgi:hypothetical protein
MPGPGAFLVGEEERREVEEILESGYLSRYRSLENPNFIPCPLSSNAWLGPTPIRCSMLFCSFNLRAHLVHLHMLEVLPSLSMSTRWLTEEG